MALCHLSCCPATVISGFKMYCFFQYFCRLPQNLPRHCRVVCHNVCRNVPGARLPLPFRPFAANTSDRLPLVRLAVCQGIWPFANASGRLPLIHLAVCH